MILGEVLIDDIAIDFDSIDECIEFKQRLMAFIKSKKRDVRDRALTPKLIFNLIKPKTNGEKRI